MVKIEEGKELIMENVISYRGVMTQGEIQERMQEIGNLIQDNQLTLSGKVTTTTFAVDPSGKFDMEILVPVNRKLNLPKEYRFKKEFKLFNSVYSRHVGNPSEINSLYKALNEYIVANNIQSITSGYNVTVKESADINEFVIDVYIGTSDNLL